MLNVALFNAKRAELAAYPVDIETIVPNAATLDARDRAGTRPPAPKPGEPKPLLSVRDRLRELPLGRPARTWPVVVKKSYPNAWVDQRVKLPRLPSGVYVIQALAAGVRTRTWLAISNDALLVKRSPDVVKAWLVTALEGRPVPGATLALYNATGRAAVARTGADGIASFAAPDAKAPLWVAARGGQPAFSRAPAPEPEKPYVVAIATDRPVYRPGHLVKFRGTVRAVRRGVYSLPAPQKVRVQIKARGDTLLYDEELPLNDWGTFAGEFALAAEPPLGQYSLEVVIGDFREYGSFEVEAYRKPEFDVDVTIPASHYLGGASVPVTISANYFFGSPVSGGKVSYQVQFSPLGREVPPRILSAAGLGSAAAARIETSYAGQGTLDTAGKLELKIPTRSVPIDRQLTVSAQVTEMALRPRQASAGTTIAAAGFRLAVRPLKQEYLPGDTATIEVHASDYDGKPVSTKARVTLVEQLEDRAGRTYEQRTDRDVTTDAQGFATTTYKMLRPGGFSVEAWARDAEGNAVYDEAYFQVVTPLDLVPAWPLLEVRLDKASYAPGDTAVLRVRTSLVGTPALLTIEGERLYRAEVVRLAGKEQALKIPVLPAYQPSVMVRLAAIRRGELVTNTAELSVPAEDKKLTLLIQPDKETYQPGEKATYTVTTRDSHGRGVPAEVGLGVIDAALYAIREDNTPNPYDLFWGEQDDRVATDYSLSATYPGGGYQAMPVLAPAPKPKSEAGGIRVRRLFLDTAFWEPSLITDAAGEGRVTFTIPDNLTTWRATARGLTKSTQAGAARAEAKVTLPLLVRLTLPRFYVRNDEGTVAAIVHNYTGAERQVRVALTAEGAELAGPGEQTVTLPAGAIKRLTWKARITGDRQARFLVSADGGAGARDATESTLPVLPDGVRRVDAMAGVTDASATATMGLPAAALPGRSSLEVSLSPSLAGPIFEALDYLVGYPYGCAEQTMERFLPDVIVTRTLKQLGAPRPEPPMLRRYVSFGLQKLLRFQHQDGGWNWWEFDQSDPFMTAYVVYGLAMARDAGYPLAAGPLPRGVDYLRRALQREEYRTARAYLLWALAFARQWDKDSLQTAAAAAQELYQQRAKLDVFSRASLALALDQLSRQAPPVPPHAGGMKAWGATFAAEARTLAGELEGAAVVDGTAAHWTADARGDGSWLDSNVEVTSQVLQALLALKPDSPQIVPAVRWLMAARAGKHWPSTKDTASAVLALTAYLRHANELSPEETVTLRVGDRTVRTLQFGRAQVFEPPVVVTVPADALAPGENTIRLEKNGPGNLYWTADLSYVLPADEAIPLERGIELRRRYRVAAEDPVTAGDQPAGSLIQVSVDVTARDDYRYCLLEEPIPAGCEVITGEEDRFPEFGCDRREVWDDRLVFYFDYLPKGTRTVTYWLRAEAPGLYRIRPGTASLMYFPEVRGEGRRVRLRVVE